MIPGMLLCADIDVGATASGEIKNGSRLLAQVWSKRLTNGRVAALFLNAGAVGSGAAKARDITVTLEALRVKPGSAVRDVWAKKSAGMVASSR
jgi:hypothetical protein